MRYAIIESGGKQYKAVEGGVLEVDRLAVEPGKNFKLDRVLLTVSGDEVQVGTPTLSGVSISAKVLEHFKSVKTFNFTYRPKKRIRQKTGHRQLYTRLTVEKIEGVKADPNAGKEEKHEPARAAAGRKSPKAEKSQVEDKKPAAKTAKTAKPAAKKSTKTAGKTAAKKPAAAPKKKPTTPKKGKK